MHWIAPSEKDTDNAALEKRLGDTAEQAVPAPHFAETDFNGGRPQGLLGLIFLRFAEVRFATQRARLESRSTALRAPSPPLGEKDGMRGSAPAVGAEVPTPRVSRRGSRVDEPAAYHAEGILYLPAEARFDYLLNLPEAENIGAKVNAAMRVFSLSASTGERAGVRCRFPKTAGVLPKTYNLFTSTLLKELLKKVSEIPASLDYDAFGRIYEYFLGEFAMSEGQGGGEPSGASSTTGTVARRVSASDSANQFYTPSSIVRLLTEVIEPYHGRILDPAFHLCANTDPQRDSISTKGPADVLGHATSGMAI